MSTNKINVIQQECENTKQTCNMNSWNDMNIGQKKWQKQIVINKMKKWNDINLSQQKVGKTKSAKTWVTTNIEVRWKMHT